LGLLGGAATYDGASPLCGLSDDNASAAAAVGGIEMAAFRPPAPRPCGAVSSALSLHSSGPSLGGDSLALA